MLKDRMSYKVSTIQRWKRMIHSDKHELYELDYLSIYLFMWKCEVHITEIASGFLYYI